jgi:hypothetical protein
MEIAASAKLFILDPISASLAISSRVTMDPMVNPELFHTIPDISLISEALISKFGSMTPCFISVTRSVPPAKRCPWPTFLRSFEASSNSVGL